MHQEQSHHINLRPQLPATPQELTQDWLSRFLDPRGTGLLVFSGLLFLVGVVAFFMRLGGGTEHREEWAYYAATVVFLFSTASAAPLLSVATRLTKGYWRKPLVRVAELFTLTGILNLVLFLPLLNLLPPLEGRRTFWMAYENAWWAPQWPIAIAAIALVLCGLGLLYTSMRPDLAAVRDLAPGRRQGFQAMLAGNWGGSTRQWKILSNGLTYLGVSYLVMLVGFHFFLSVELAITLVPGWRDPIFPAFHAISSIQAGLATLVLALGFLRYFGGYKDYLALDQFWNPGKMLMAFTMLWFYFWWSAFIIFWYGKTPAEIGVLQVIMFGPYFTPFVIGFVFSFVIPLLLLIWNPIRVSINGPILASVFILIGNFFDRVRIYGGAFTADPVGMEVEHIAATHFPQLADFLLPIGAVGGVIFIMLLAMRLIPPMALWELKEGQLLTRPHRLLRNEVIIIGKPE